MRSLTAVLTLPPKWLFLMLCLTGSLPGYGIAQDAANASRVMVLHGVWKNDVWESTFDRNFSLALNELSENEIHVSSQYLGLNRALPASSRERLLSNINAIVQEQSVDLIVGVQPDAIEFLLELPISSVLPKLLVLPSDETIAELSSDIPMVLSAWRSAMEITLEQIFTLLPETERVDVIVGNSGGDLVYLRRFQDIARSWTDRAEFIYHIGESRDAIATTAANSAQNTVIFTLPYNSFGPGQSPVASESLNVLVEQSGVPVFGIYDSQLEYGVTGGHMTSVGDYADSAALLALAILSGANPGAVEGRASSLYNWEAGQRFSLPFARLGSDISIVHQPSSLFDDYPFLSALAINLIIVLLLSLAFMFWMYRRSVAARERIAATELAVRDSEERYRLLADNAADVIWVIEENTPYLKYCSPANEQITGYTAEESMQTHFREMLSPKDLKQLNERMLAAGPEPVVQEVKLRHKDGHWVWCEIVVQPSKVLSHGKREWVGITRDITKRRESEQEQARLEDQVRQSQKFESLGTLAGGIAHDFNNILTVIIGIADMLRLEFKDQPNSTRLINRLLTASDKARELVQQILTFSRQSKGEKAIVDAAKLVDQSIKLLRSGKPEYIEINSKVQRDNVTIAANANQIEQVILNLVTNAIEAVPHKGGRINVNLRTQRFTVYHTATHGEIPPGDYVCIEISDNGVGMDSEKQRKVFDPFYTSKELGNGMGLAIVHGIIMDHGGAIDLRSEVNKGTTITLYLPQVDGDVADLANTGNIEQPKESGRRILIIDDQEEVLEIAGQMLKKLGHDCVVSSNPHTAMDTIRDQPDSLDLVITDYSMPGATGIDVVKFCHRHCPNLPIIISTGYGEQVAKYTKELDKPVSVLDKPYNLNGLREAVEAALAVEA